MVVWVVTFAISYSQWLHSTPICMISKAVITRISNNVVKLYEYISVKTRLCSNVVVTLVYRDPQLQVGENYSYLFNLRPKICKSWCSTLWNLNLPLSSSSTRSRELLSQFSTCSGWRWFEIRENCHVLVNQFHEIFHSKTPSCWKKEVCLQGCKMIL